MFEYRGLLDRSRRDPLAWDDLFRGFDMLFRESDREAPLSSFGRAVSALREEAERFVLEVEVPGLTDKDVKVDLHDGVLTVTAERSVEPPPAYKALRRERSAVRFSRSFTLGDRVDPERTTAEIKDGVLTVGIAKAAGVQKKSIPIKVS
jgi:HSP20 family molecular chaperone IbpA